MTAPRQASSAGAGPAANWISVGLHVLGIGPGSRPEIVAAVAGQADELGFATLWCGEHVVMVDEPASRYPYSGDGRIAVPPDADWLDPLLALTFAAAHSQRITLATGILLLPEHNPLLIAKQAATLDVLSGGRFALGVGVGWSGSPIPRSTRSRSVWRRSRAMYSSSRRVRGRSRRRNARILPHPSVVRCKGRSRRCSSTTS